MNPHKEHPVAKIFASLSVSVSIAGALFITTAHADNSAPTPAATLTEIEQAIGFVPTFIRSIPASLLPGWWDQVKSLEMNPKTGLDATTKELIALAVASQIPCEYCIYFHTRVAKTNGATDQQIQEAVGMAALTRMGSTLMHGMQTDLAQYKKEVDRAFKPAKK
jgi:AhpD family alkylhydroperoxidase